MFIFGNSGCMGCYNCEIENLLEKAEIKFILSQRSELRGDFVGLHAIIKGSITGSTVLGAAMHFWLHVFHLINKLLSGYSHPYLWHCSSVQLSLQVMADIDFRNSRDNSCLYTSPAWLALQRGRLWSVFSCLCTLTEHWYALPLWLVTLSCLCILTKHHHLWF